MILDNVIGIATAGLVGMLGFGGSSAPCNAIDTWKPQDRLAAMDDYELIKKWGQIITVCFVWHPQPGETCMVKFGKHPTAESAWREIRPAALDMGYKPPKWHELWRWRERPMPMVDKLESS